MPPVLGGGCTGGMVGTAGYWATQPHGAQPWCGAAGMYSEVLPYGSAGGPSHNMFSASVQSPNWPQMHGGAYGVGAAGALVITSTHADEPFLDALSWCTNPRLLNSQVMSHQS